MNDTYRIDIVVDTKDSATPKLGLIDKHVQQTEKSMLRLSRMTIAPAMTLADRVTPRLTVIGSALRNLASRTYTVTVRAVDRASGVIGSIYHGVMNLISSPLTWLGAAGGIAGLIGYPLSLAGDMMQAMTGFEYFLGSRGRAEAFNERLIDFAARTPFEYTDLRKYAAQLLGTQMGESMVFRTLSAFGDAAALTGAGKHGMEMALYGFKQMGTTGVVMMEELRQVTENLLIPMDKIGAKLGIAKENLRDIGNLAIEGAKGQEAILEVLEENYRGGMTLASRQWHGLMSTIKDFMNLRVFQSWGDGLAEALMPKLSNITDWLSGTDLTLKRMSQDRFVSLARMLTMLHDEPGRKGFAASRIGVEGLAMDLRDLGNAAGDWAVRGIDRLIERWNEFDKKMSSADKFATIVGELSDKVIVGVAYAGARLGVEMGKAFATAAIAAATESPLAAILLGLVTPGPIQVKLAVTSTLLGIGAASNLAESIPNTEKFPTLDTSLKVPGMGFMAWGGIATSPVIAAEDGDEAIVPLTKPRRGRQVLAQAAAALGVGGQIAVDLGGIHVYVNDLDSDASALAIGRVFLREISEYLENRA